MVPNSLPVERLYVSPDSGNEGAVVGAGGLPVDTSWQDREALANLAVQPQLPLVAQAIGKNISNMTLPNYDVNGLPVAREPVAEASMPTNQVVTKDSIIQQLLGTGKDERYQLWPERLVRDALSAPHDVLTSKTPLTSQDLIKPALDMSALAGTGGLGGVGAEAGTSLGAGPFLRPVLKYEGKIYKAPMGGQHMDAIPKDLQAEFTRQAMSGEDISNFNFGFMNHKGQFLDREKALDYAIKEGLLSPHDARYGALTSTMDFTPKVETPKVVQTSTGYQAIDSKGNSSRIFSDKAKAQEWADKNKIETKPRDYLDSKDFAKQPSNDIKDYNVAVKDLDTNKVFSGDKNSIHPGLQYQDNKFLKNPKDGFVDQNGNFLTRDEFREKFGVSESQQLARAQKAASTLMADSSKPGAAIKARMDQIISDMDKIVSKGDTGSGYYDRLKDLSEFDKKRFDKLDKEYKELNKQYSPFTSRQDNYLKADSSKEAAAIDAASKYPHPQHLEDAATEWARGNMTGKELMKKIRSEGWSIDPHALQRKGSWIEVFDPNGNYHELQP